MSPVGGDDSDVLGLDPKRNVLPDQLLHDERLVEVGERLVEIFAALRRLEEVAAGRVYEHQVGPGLGTRGDATKIGQSTPERCSLF